MEARRSFLKKIFAGLILCTADPIKLFSQASAEPSISNQSKASLSNILSLKREAKTFFHKREYTQASLLYQQLIDLTPSDITCYDGLKKVLGAQQSTIEVVKLYKDGLKKNPSLPVFYDRVAKSLISISTGNEKHLSQYLQSVSNENLFQEAIELYLNAIELSPESKYLYLGLGDAWKKIEEVNKRNIKNGNELIEISSEVERKVKLLLEKHQSEWDLTRQSHKPIALNQKNINNIDFTTFVKHISGKKRRTLYFEDEKLNREKNILRMKRRSGDLKALMEIKQKNFSQLLFLGMFMLTEGSLYSNFIGLLKRELRDKEQMRGFRLFYEQFYNKRKDSWGILAKAIYYKKCDIQLNDALTLLSQEDKILDVYSGKKIAAMYEGMAELYLKKKNYQKGEEALLKGLDLLGNNGLALSLKIKYANLHYMKGDYSKAVSMLSYIANRPYIKEDMENILSASSFTPLDLKESSTGEYLKVYRALYKIQQQQGDTDGLNETIAWIKEIDYNNPLLPQMTNLN